MSHRFYGTVNTSRATNLSVMISLVRSPSANSQQSTVNSQQYQ
ncbi:hypothetical protein [Nostoc linckia]|nr:hypothetical protein [Nostoc linckia]